MNTLSLMALFIPIRGVAILGGFRYLSLCKKTTWQGIRPVMFGGPPRGGLFALIVHLRARVMRLLRASLSSSLTRIPSFVSREIIGRLCFGIVWERTP